MRDMSIAVFTVCAVGIFFAFFYFATGEQRIGLSWLFFLRGETPAPKEAAIIDIDDVSKAKNLPDKIDVRGFECLPNIGNTVRPFAGPMPRCLYARLIDILAASNPTAIVIDISFEKNGTLEEDLIVAAAMREAGNVIVLRRMSSVVSDIYNNVQVQLAPINPHIAEAAFAWAPFQLPKGEFVDEYWTKLENIGGFATLPAMALLAPYRNALQSASTSMGMEDLVRELLRSDGQRSQAAEDVLNTLDKEARQKLAFLRKSDSYLLNFFGGPGTIEILDGFELLKSGEAPNLEGRTVFIGQVHLDTYQQADSFQTFFSQENGIDLAGVEIAATAFSNLYHEQTLERPAPITMTVFVLAFGVIFAFLVTMAKPHIGIPAVFIILLITSIIALTLFSEQRIWLPIVSSFAMAGTALLTGAFIQRERILFWAKTWVPGQIQSQMWSRWDASAKPKQITGLCLKCDIENYTAASESVSDSSAFLRDMDEYMSEAGRIVSKCGGEIIVPGDDSFIAFWEIPLEESDEWRTVIDSVLQLSQLTLQVDGEAGPIIRRNRIGLDYGPFSVGGMGVKGGRALNAQGMVVNRAARLESLNKELGTRILLNAILRPALTNYELRDMGEYHLKGLSEPARVAELLPHPRKEPK